MKTGFSLFSFPENAVVSGILPKIKQAGYDGVEFVMSEAGYLNHHSTHREILELKHQAEDAGLSVPSVGVWSLWKNNLVSNDKKIRTYAMDIVKKQLEAAEILGADTILVVPGYVGCDFVEKEDRVRYDHAYVRCVEVFQILSENARLHRVSIGIENVWNRFLLSPVEMKNLLKAVGSEWVGVYFDVGNIIYIGYPEDWIEILGDSIKKIHLSDYKREQAGLGAFTDLFAGDVDFYKVADALKKIGYNDYITLEMLPNYKQFPDASIFSNKYAVDCIKKLCETS